ncbi:MAG TPA: hypothetical protein VF395_05500, partial [Polyangiaceae bacterium]
MARLVAAAGTVAALVLELGSGDAHAQGFGDQFGGGMGPGMGPRGGQSTGGKKPKKKSNEPETHAASGASDDLVPAGAEPTLPAKPLETTETVKKKIGSDAALDEPETGRGQTTSRHFYGPWYDEESGSYR